MATQLSDIITNITASPPVANSAADAGGKSRELKGTLEVATTSIDTIGDTINLARVPAAAKISKIEIYSDALDSDNAVTVNCGLYTTDGVAKDADCYATASTVLQAANVIGTDLRFEAADIAEIGQYVYEDATDSDASEGYYDIYLTVAAAATSADAGTLSFRIVYTLD